MAPIYVARRSVLPLPASSKFDGGKSAAGASSEALLVGAVFTVVSAGAVSVLLKSAWH